METPRALTSVVVDSREPRAIQKLPFGGVDKSVAPLDYPDSKGSYDLLGLCADSEMIAIERATPTDLLGKLSSNRLFPQLVALRQQTRWAYLVITGGLFPGANDTVWVANGSAVGSRETGWTWASVQGCLLTAQEIGVHVVFANGELDYSDTVLRLGKRDHSALRVQPARDVELLSEYEQVISALPAIGPERARALLQYCGTPARVLQFLTDDRASSGTVKVPGVGSGMKRLTRDALGLDEWQELTVLARDVLPGQAGA